MKRLNIFISILLITLFAGSTVFADSITLDIDSVMENAVNNNYNVKTADIKIQQNQNLYDNSFKEAAKIDDELSSGKVPENQVLQYVQRRDYPQMEYKYALYKYNNAKEVAKNQARFSIYKEYETLLNDKSNLDLEQIKLNNAKDNLNTAKLQLNLGTISPADEKAQEAKYAKEQANFNQIQRQYDAETMNMNKTLNLPLDTTYKILLKDKLTPSPYIRSYDDYNEDALKNRFEVLNGNEYIKLMKFEFDTTRGMDPYTMDAPYKIARYNWQMAKDQLDIQKINISLEINNLYNDLQNKSKQIDSLRDSYNLAYDQYNKALLKYNAGVMSKLDKNQYYINMLTADNSLKSGERDVWLAQIKLNYACGLGYDASSLLK
ncbi:TolC family protein [Clostridium sp. JN-1]|uniref:TolC family protein n=1 Tax=Clostridium sp. JN-1 TaxID=2483110 RepID=UPI000F0B930C|nr:TolC family protein [Clostridium sp. JN-1]